MLKHILLYLFLTVIFISCGDDSGTNPSTQPTHDPALVGTWELTTLKVNGNVFDPSMAEEIPVKIKFEAGGTGIVWFEINGIPTIFTWSTTGNKLTIGDEDIGNYIVSGNIITISFVEDGDNLELIYTKSATPLPSTGSMSFNCTQGSFSATGIYNENASSGQGVGWYDSVTVMAYNIVSPTNVSIAQITFQGTIKVGTFSFSEFQAGFLWALNVNLEDSTSSTNNFYLLASGQVDVTSYSGSSIQGTFSGSGSSLLGTFSSVTNGSFSLSSTGAALSTLPEEIKRIVNKIFQKKPVN